MSKFEDFFIESRNNEVKKRLHSLKKSYGCGGVNKTIPKTQIVMQKNIAEHRGLCGLTKT
jgi:hypothetical protein